MAEMVFTLAEFMALKPLDTVLVYIQGKWEPRIVSEYPIQRNNLATVRLRREGTNKLGYVYPSFPAHLGSVRPFEEKTSISKALEMFPEVWADIWLQGWEAGWQLKIRPSREELIALFTEPGRKGGEVLLLKPLPSA